MQLSASFLPLAAAAVALTACGSSHSTQTAPAVTAAAAHSATPAPSCKQQYTAWQTGPAKPYGKQLETALNAVQSAGATEDIPVTLAALQTAGTAAASLGQYPMPKCADPHGYWTAILTRVKAAGDNAGSASGLTGVILAEAPLKDVPGLETKLDAELKQRGVS